MAKDQIRESPRVRHVLRFCDQKFELSRSVFIGVLVPNHRWQGLQHFPSLNRTLSHKDSKEIEKEIKSV
jgi:hypothetical protein